MTEADDFMSKGRPISWLNRPTHELLLAARRERALLLHAMIASAARKVSLAFANLRQRRQSRVASQRTRGA